MSSSAASSAATVERSRATAADSSEGPTVLSYRHPDDFPRDQPGQDATERESLPLVVLRLPDLDEPLPQTETTSWVVTLEPIVSKVLIGAIAVVGLVLLVLMWRGVGSNTERSGANSFNDVAVQRLGAPKDRTITADKSTTPVAPFRVPMVQSKDVMPSAAQNPARWPSDTKAAVQPPQQSMPSKLPADVPPDMPRYAPDTSTPEQGPELDAAARYEREPHEHIADQRSFNSPSGTTGHQPGVARFKDTIDTPNLEPSYDGTRSRLR